MWYTKHRVWFGSVSVPYLCVRIFKLCELSEKPIPSRISEKISAMQSYALIAFANALGS